MNAQHVLLGVDRQHVCRSYVHSAIPEKGDRMNPSDWKLDAERTRVDEDDERRPDGGRGSSTLWARRKDDLGPVTGQHHEGVEPI